MGPIIKKSIIRKGKTLLKDGLTPFMEGKKNFENPLFCMEELAKQRGKTCIGCKFYKKEPVSFLQVEDTRIPELSNMYCEDCGCELPYKLRQNIKKCKKWQK